MKIRITKPLPVEKTVCPAVGGVYDVDSFRMEKNGPSGKWQPGMFFIRMGAAQVGVMPDECEIVEEGEHA